MKEYSPRRVKEIYGNQCANKDDPRFTHQAKVVLHHIFMRCEGAHEDKLFFSDPKSNRIPLCKDCELFVHQLMDPDRV